ncbi:hypothetical protein L1987_77287 [Smallanthus sonchifolius]|uniref:Uncharacterized protein n=1 Tax=Smallanthus sonchifolius TaxID=185202 RepID=A0ACB8ZAF3_9ASTR|nr:hypothetical protein L1987_77287 [Smallanthus sonchifolius]
MLDSLGDESYKPNPRLARVLNILIILHAELDMNCYTAAARHLTSSGVDIYTTLAEADGALYRPLLGGANEIFERKDCILEQVQQQADSYTHEFTSRLLIDRITPPPWLLSTNSNSHSLDSNVMLGPPSLLQVFMINTYELILLPHFRLAY